MTAPACAAVDCVPGVLSRCLVEPLGLLVEIWREVLVLYREARLLHTVPMMTWPWGFS